MDFVDEPTRPASDIATNPRPHGLADITPQSDQQKHNDPTKPLHRDASADPPLISSPASGSGPLFSSSASDNGVPLSARSSSFTDTTMEDVALAHSRKRKYDDETASSNSPKRQLKSFAHFPRYEHGFNEDNDSYVQRRRDKLKMALPGYSYNLSKFRYSTSQPLRTPFTDYPSANIFSSEGYRLYCEEGKPVELFIGHVRVNFHGKIGFSIRRKINDLRSNKSTDFQRPSQSRGKAHQTRNPSHKTKDAYEKAGEAAKSHRSAKVQRIEIQEPQIMTRQASNIRPRSRDENFPRPESSPKPQTLKPQENQQMTMPAAPKKPAASKIQAHTKPAKAQKPQKQQKSTGAHQAFANDTKKLMDSRLNSESQEIIIGGQQIKCSKTECMHLFEDAYAPPTADLAQYPLDDLLKESQDKQTTKFPEWISRDPLRGRISREEEVLAWSIGLKSIHQYQTQKRRAMLGMAEMRRQGYQTPQASIGKAHFQSFGNIDVTKMSKIFVVFERWGWLNSAPQNYMQQPLWGLDEKGQRKYMPDRPYEGKTKRAGSSRPQTPNFE
ncbi:MAG: hypothetical protein Q9227_008632 [Pyrenula ochraceoflavens]